MKRVMKRITGILLVICMLLATIHYNTPRALADGGSSKSEETSSGYYQWHKAKTTDDLKRYLVENEDPVNYKGKWVPIIIVACYNDQPLYYWNSQCEAKKYGSESELAPYMRSIDDTTETGSYLKAAVSDNKDTFISKGDLGAMHMYYHGKQTSGDGYREPNGLSITEEAWSLTTSSVGDYSSDTPSTLWGVQNHWSYIAMDLNNVKTWSGTTTLPITTCPRGDYSDSQFHQAWTFYNDTKNGEDMEGQFLITNVFAWPLGDDLDWTAGKTDSAYAITIGAALSNSSRYSEASVKTRGVLQTASRAAGYIYGKNHVYSGDELKNSIVNQFNYKYGEYGSSDTRVSFQIYIGEEIKGQSELNDTTISKGMTTTLAYGNIISIGHSIYVKKGGTLIIPENGLLYLDGTIYVEGGTLIIGKNACVSSQTSTPPRVTERNDNGDSGYSGRIECYNGGVMIIQEGAKVFLNHGLSMDNGACVNDGTLVLNQLLSMSYSQIQIGQTGNLGLGFYYGPDPTLFVHEKTYPSQNLATQNQQGNHYFCSVLLLSFFNSRILMDTTDATSADTRSNMLQMSAMTYEYMQAEDAITMNIFPNGISYYYGTPGNVKEISSLSFKLKNETKELGSVVYDIGIRTNYKAAGTYTYHAINGNTIMAEYMVIE